MAVGVLHAVWWFGGRWRVARWVVVGRSLACGALGGRWAIVGVSHAGWWFGGRWVDVGVSHARWSLGSRWRVAHFVLFVGPAWHRNEKYTSAALALFIGVSITQNQNE